MDVLAASVVAVDACGNLCRFPVPGRAATVIRCREHSGFAIATEHGLVLTDDAFTVFEHLTDVIDSPLVRTNDGGCDPLGGFVVGTMSYDERPDAGAVYRVTRGGKVTKLIEPVSISNGVQWSADGGTVYYIDTPTRRVDTFDVDQATGAWSARREHIRIEDPQGFPDGMAIDEEDGLWVALWGSGAVHHYDAKGRLVELIAVPGVTQTSSCTFGGDKRNVLYITTSRQRLTANREPDAGAVFAIQTGVRGAVPGRFAG